jgi:hypothetical protein
MATITANVADTQIQGQHLPQIFWHANTMATGTTNAVGA